MTCDVRAARRFFSWRHFLFHFLPLQILVTTAAILSFVAASDVKQRAHTAILLSLVAGIIGFVVTFITTLDRHCNWKSKADADKNTALVYSKIRQDIYQASLSFWSKGDKARTEQDAQQLIRSFKEKMENIEELSGNHLVPREIRMLYDHVFAQISLKYHLVDVREGVGESVLAKVNHKITSHWYWPFFLPSDTEKLADEIVNDLKDELAERQEALEKERDEDNA